MEYKITEHIRTRASLVVLVIDDYTGKAITDGSILVSITDKVKPVRKSEGYYVFLNLEQTKVVLSVSGDKYATEIRSIDLDNIDKADPVVKLRIKPGRNYPMPGGATSIYGHAEPLSEIRVISDNIQKYYRLLYDYEQTGNKDIISIFNPDNTDLDGKLMTIKDKERADSEIFTIAGTKDRENNLYRMEKPLESSYKKIGAKIYPVFITNADEKGEYFLPLWNIGEEGAQCHCEMLGSSSVKQYISLVTGKMNRLDFTS